MYSSQSSSQSRRRGSTATPSSKLTTNTTKTKTTDVYDRDFQQNLSDHDIYPNEYEYLDDRMSSESKN